MNIEFRNATPADLLLLFGWKNDPEALKQSFHPTPVSIDGHTTWLQRRLDDPNSLILVFEGEHAPVGVVRFENERTEGVIGITIDAAFRGHGLSKVLLEKACDYYFSLYPGNTIVACIKLDNLASYKAFLSLGFEETDRVNMEGVESYKLVKKHVVL